MTQQFDVAILGAGCAECAGIPRGAGTEDGHVELLRHARQSPTRTPAVASWQANGR